MDPNYFLWIRIYRIVYPFLGVGSHDPEQSIASPPGDMKAIFSSSSSTKLPGEAPSTSTIRSQHAAPAGAESSSIVKTYNKAVAAGVLIVMDSGVRCKCSSRVHPSGWGGHFLASGGRTSYGHVHSVARGPSSSSLLLLLQPLPPRRLSKLNEPRSWPSGRAPPGQPLPVPRSEPCMLPYACEAHLRMRFAERVGYPMSVSGA